VQLRQSLKFILASYMLSMLIAMALLVWWLTGGPANLMPWGLSVPVVLMLWTLERHIQRRLTKLTISGDRLKYESGLLSKTTRTMEMVKVQDVTVMQGLGQRIFNIGDLALETAGESSRIVMRSIDRPQQAADHILELAHTQRLTGEQKPKGTAGV
jgi:membrane protein YdbS with pleckstrin-like domain